MDEEITRRVAWSRKVYRGRGKKFVIVTCIDLPRPRMSGPLFITNRQQFLAAYGNPLPTVPNPLTPEDVFYTGARQSG